MKILLFVFALSAGNLLADHHSSWKHQSEAILNSFTGNSDQMTIGVDHESTTNFRGGWNFGAHGEYNYGETGGAVSARNWNAGIDLGKKFTEKLSGYYAADVAGDSFQGIDSRIDNEVGLRYDFISPYVLEAADDGKESNKMGTYSFGSTFLYGSLGYQFSIENWNVPGTAIGSNNLQLPDSRNNLVAGLGYGVALTQSLAFLSEAKWIRTLGNDDRNLVEAFAGFRSTLSKAFSLKFGYELAYNDNPLAGKKDTDGKYVVSLLATY